jgi:hypothetical protein
LCERRFERLVRMAHTRNVMLIRRPIGTGQGPGRDQYGGKGEAEGAIHG